jgi:hypothetical protein
LRKSLARTAAAIAVSVSVVGFGSTPAHAEIWQSVYEGLTGNECANAGTAGTYAGVYKSYTCKKMEAGSHGYWLWVLYAH